jgi:hypothetical protein
MIYLWLFSRGDLSERVGRLLEREWYLERDSHEGSLLLDGLDDDVIKELQGSSITHRIAVGAQRGKKVFTLKTLPGIIVALV